MGVSSGGSVPYPLYTDLDTNPGEKLNADPARIECGSRSKTLVLSIKIAEEKHAPIICLANVDHSGVQ